jgi:malate/lactate dehydrogenase
VDAHIVGERRTSSVFVWSSARIGELKRRTCSQSGGIGFQEFSPAVEYEVRYANLSFIEGIGASRYGVGMVAGRVARVVLRDERAVLPVGPGIPALRRDVPPSGLPRPVLCCSATQTCASTPSPISRST